MSDHHRYYKDSYGASSSSKRYHSPSDPPRMGMSSNDYYDSSDSRSKRSRTDSYGAHTSSGRYADYSASSSSSSGRYKTSSSSSSYYDLPGYKPSSSTSSSTSKYVDDYKGSGSSSRSTSKSNVRRIPPPLTPPSLSSSKSSLRLQPLMKVSLSSSSSGVGSGSAKDYYGSRMRQAPPEHHYSYSGSHSSSSSYGKSDFKRPASYGSSKGPPVSSSSYHSTARSHAGGGSASYRSSATASRRLLARSRAPPPASGIGSRAKPRSSNLAAARRDEEIRRRKAASAKRSDYKSRSGSRGSDDRSGKGSSKSKKEADTNKTQEKEQKEKGEEQNNLEYVSVGDGQIVIEDVAGDDDDVEEGTQSGEVNSSVDKNTTASCDDDNNRDGQSNAADEDKAVVKSEKTEENAEGGDKGTATRALLKLHCPYCDVRCISFREFTFHLRSSVHTRTMQTAVSDFKRKLLKVRQEMKDDQRKREKEEKVLSDTSSFCRVCELNFRTDPKEHESNEIHNKIKALIYRRCDICDIDFRIWKVHIYHMAALEHAKRVAMKELQEREATGDNVKGTNLSPQELGLDLIEIRTVFYCNACIRYIPIKGEEDEAKRNHCMTLNHLKSVEEFNDRERRRAQREEARERNKRRKQDEQDKEQKSAEGDATTSANTTVDGNDQNGNTSVDSENKTSANGETVEGVQIKQEPNDKSDEEEEKNNETTNTSFNSQTTTAEDTESVGQNLDGQVQSQVNNQNEAEEDDDDEIELHAGVDDVEDESVDVGDWSRRTRSSQRGDGSSK